MTGFEDLEVYKIAIQFRQKIFELAKSFPPEEKYRLIDQIIRSTRKCPANIAEGYGRFHYQENIQFSRIARGSLTETQDHLNCVSECKYISQEQHTDLKADAIQLIKMINGYIRLYLEIFCMQLTLSFSDTLHLFFAPYRRVCSSK